jgi:translation initiation factor IF-2
MKLLENQARCRASGPEADTRGVQSWIRSPFKVPKAGTIAGCMVTEGVIDRKSKVRLVRDGVQVWDGVLSSLRRFKDDAKEVREGFECGMSIEGFNDLKIGDHIESYKMESVARTLAASAAQD